MLDQKIYCGLTKKAFFLLPGYRKTDWLEAAYNRAALDLVLKLTVCNC